MEILMGVLDKCLVPYLWITGVFAVIMVVGISVEFYGMLREKKRTLGYIPLNQKIILYARFVKLIFSMLIKSVFWPLRSIFGVIKFIFK